MDDASNDVVVPTGLVVVVVVVVVVVLVVDPGKVMAKTRKKILEPTEKMGKAIKNYDEDIDVEGFDGYGFQKPRRHRHWY